MAEILAHSDCDDEQIYEICRIVWLDGSILYPFPNRDELSYFGRSDLCGTEEYAKIVESVLACSVLRALGFFVPIGKFHSFGTVKVFHT